MRDISAAAHEYTRVHIATHKSPDADAIASAYGLKCLLEGTGKIPVEILVSASDSYKVNVKRLIERFGIPMTVVSQDYVIRDDELLILVDCQYQSVNTPAFQARNIGVIDHHIEQDMIDYTYKDIQPKVGACASIIFNYLVEAEIAVESDLATIMYFGIYMDTNGFTGQLTNRDLDARDCLVKVMSERDFDHLRLSSLAFSDLKIFASGLLATERYENIVFSSFEQCDDSLLGHIADLLTELDEIQIVVVYTERSEGYKLSIRSYHNYVTAEDITKMLCRPLGGGGGNRSKAGGFIFKQKFHQLHSVISFSLFVKTEVINYVKSLILLETGSDPFTVLDKSRCLSYKKRDYFLRYLNISDYFDDNIVIKTLEGQAEATPEDLVIIGLKNEIWPVSARYFSENYVAVDTPAEACLSDSFLDDYGITLQSERRLVRITRESIGNYQVCRPKSGRTVNAIELKTPVKVRTKWGDFLAKAGDYLVYHSIDDYYVCDGEIFNQTYCSAD